jgi:DNA-binding CsgD family transcriptional regulator
MNAAIANEQPRRDMGLISTDLQEVTKHSHELNFGVIVPKQALITLCRPTKSIFRRNQAKVTYMESRPPATPNSFNSSAANLSGLSNLPDTLNLNATRDVLAALTYGLEMVRCGALLATEDGNVQLANRTARAILQKKDGIALLQSSLVAERSSDTRMLRTALHSAIRNPERGEPEQSPFTLQRRTSVNALVVRVIPGPGLDCWESNGQRTALLKMYDHDPDLGVDEKALVSIYGLTRGEAALAAKVVQGKSIEAAADELCISPHTARTHLKRIFMKTDTHRQPELVLRILMLVL